MKKVIFVWAVIFAVNFCFPLKTKADESNREYQRQAAIELCDENAELSQILDDSVGINSIYFTSFSGVEAIILPPSRFFNWIKEIVQSEGQEEDYGELLTELVKNNRQLELAVKQRVLTAKWIKK